MTATALKSAKPDLSAIYSLADHLDATLAMGEDLLRQELEIAPLTAGDANTAITQRQQQISSFARQLRALELGMTARLLQARARAIAVRETHPRFALLIGLFIGGTAPLADAASTRQLGDISELALATGPDVLAFLKTRGLVEAATASLSGVDQLKVSDDYLLATHIHLGTLMDMIAQFTESLDLAFDLYAEAT
jgi:hypothetical protein